MKNEDIYRFFIRTSAGTYVGNKKLISTTRGIIFSMRILLLLLLLLPGVHGYQQGYVKVWEKSFPYEIADVQVFAYHADGIKDDIAVAVGRKVYFFNSSGGELGVYVGRSPFTALTAYTLETGRERVVAGSLDDRVYAFWKPYRVRYLYSSTQEEPGMVSWYYDAGDDVYTLESLDLDEDRRRETVGVGTGSYYTTSPGMFILLNTTPVNRSVGVLWQRSFGSEVTVISSFDPDGDSFPSHVVVAQKGTVYVMDSRGRGIWSRSFGADVRAVAPADLSHPGIFKELLVGAGSRVQAISSRNLPLWSLTFPGEVESVLGVDEDRDGETEYYLVSAGEYITAIRANASGAMVLWRYYAGERVGRIASISLGNRSMVDLVAYHGSTLRLYRHELIRVPEVEARVEDGEGLKLELTNTGYGVAEELIAKIEVRKGNLSVLSTTIRREVMKRSSVLALPLNLTESGNYTIMVEAAFYDTYGVRYRKSWELSGVVEGEEPPAEEEQAEEVKRASVTLNLSAPEEVREGSTFNVTVVLRNTGNAKAEVLLNLSTGGNVTLTLPPGKERVLNLSVRAERRLSALRSWSMGMQAVAAYDAGRAEAQVEVRVKPSRVKYLALVLPLLAAGALVLLRGRGSRESSIEEQVARIYMQYRRAGKAPPYSAFRELGLDKKTLKEMLSKLKREGRIE